MTLRLQEGSTTVTYFTDNNSSPPEPAPQGGHMETETIRSDQVSSIANIADGRRASCALGSRKGLRRLHSEVDGSDPPFMLPGAGTAVLRNSHLRNTPWGVAPVSIIPAGRAREEVYKKSTRTERLVALPQATKPL